MEVDFKFFKVILTEVLLSQQRIEKKLQELREDVQQLKAKAYGESTKPSSTPSKSSEKQQVIIYQSEHDTTNLMVETEIISNTRNSTKQRKKEKQKKTKRSSESKTSKSKESNSPAATTEPSMILAEPTPPITTTSTSVVSTPLPEHQDIPPTVVVPQNDAVPVDTTPVTVPRNQLRKNIKETMDEEELNPVTKKIREIEKHKRKKIQQTKKEQGPREVHLNGGPTSRLLINPSHGPEERDVFIPDEIAPFLTPYQIDGVRFLWENIVWMKDLEGCILADSMGLGKTLQVITFLSAFLEAKLGSTVLIIAPATVVSNWVQEFKKWVAPHRLMPLYTLGKTNHERLSLIGEWAQKGGVLLLGYEMYKILTAPPSSDVSEAQFARYLCDPGPDLVVVDEGHKISNPQSNLSATLKRIRTTKRIALTGYPLQNKLAEYWCMVDFVRPDYLGTLSEFRNMFENPINNGLCADSRPSDVQLARKKMYTLSKLLKSFIKRRDVQYLTSTLPPKFEFVISMALSDIQTALYKAYLAYRHHSLGTDAGATNVIAGQGLLLKICNHPDILKNAIKVSKKPHVKQDTQTDVKENIPIHATEEEKEIDDMEVEEEQQDWSWAEPLLQSSKYEDGKLSNSPKMLALFEIMERCMQLKDKLLVFSQSIQTLDCIEYFIKQHNQNCDKLWQYKYFRLDGSTPQQERQRQITVFNSTDCAERFFLLSTKAGGLGINLTAANRVVVFDVCWNPSHDIESIYRVFRFGQTKQVFVYRLVAGGTIESKMYDRQVLKQGLSKNIVDERPTKRSISRVYGEALLQLVDVKPVDQSELKVLPEDAVLKQVLHKHPQLVCGVHQHDSLLVDDKDEALREEDRKAVDEFVRKELHINTDTKKQDTSTAAKQPPTSKDSTTLEHKYNACLSVTFSSGKLKSSPSSTESDRHKRRDRDSVKSEGEDHPKKAKTLPSQPLPKSSLPSHMANVKTRKGADFRMILSLDQPNCLVTRLHLLTRTFWKDHEAWIQGHASRVNITTFKGSASMETTVVSPTNIFLQKNLSI